MILSATGLHKRFGAHTALHAVDLQLEAGEVVGFLGPNGAGKTTTMQILTGYITPTAGSVMIDGIDQRADAQACRRRIGYLPQDLPLYREMHVAGYLDHVARLKQVPRSERRAQVLQAMERTGLREVERRHIHKLSGGNRQRVGLAQALLGDPPILILDEATAGLDPAQVANFRDLIRQLATGHTILLSTHILGEVERCCDRVVMIDRGRTMLDETVAALQQRAHEIRRVRLRLSVDPAPLAADLQGCAWITRCERDDDALVVDLDPEAQAQLVERACAHGVLLELQPWRRSLEEVFRDLISRSRDPASPAADRCSSAGPAAAAPPPNDPANAG
ncbi:MAG: ABC transporter ATP-binding protein [Planctomycetota bacterium]